MLTYRTGAAGSPSTALAMAKHLLQQTLPTERANVAAYYLGGMVPPTNADETLARHAEMVASGRMSREVALEKLIDREIERAKAEGRAVDPATEALGRVVAAGLMTRGAAVERLVPSSAPMIVETATPAPAANLEAPNAFHDVRRRVVSREDATVQLRAAMESIGLRPPAHIEADGKPHYCAAVSGTGKAYNKSGRYTAWLDGVPSAFLYNFKTQQELKWTASGGELQTVSAEQQALDAARQQEEREAAELARRMMEEHVARESTRVWEAAGPADGHPYLEKKGLDGTGLKQGQPGLTLRLKNSAGEWYNLKTAGKLLSPMADADGKLWSLQTIDPDGTKKYLAGGRRMGTFSTYGNFSGTDAIGIGEGVATVKAVHDTTWMPTVAGYDAGGLMAAAQAMRQLYPDRALVMLADNDHENPLKEPARANAGLDKATEAARAVNASVALPSWSVADKGLSDWDDWIRKHGREATQAAITPAIREAEGIMRSRKDAVVLAERDLAREGATVKLDEAIAWAQSAIESGGTVARIRGDTHPTLVDKLGLSMTRPLVASEIANLLNGDKADGGRVPGKQIQQPTRALTELLGLSPTMRPAREDIVNILDGKTASGAELASPEEKRATRRFLTKFGCKEEAPTPEQRENLLAGHMADGTPVSHHDYVRRVDSSKSRIGYIDLTFSAPKSFSVAWALEPTEAGRAILDQCFNDAVETTLKLVETQLAQARKGKGAKHGYEQGHMTYVAFDHYASRPTVAIIQKDGKGNPYTERVTVKDGGILPADPQRHRHVLVPNTILAPDGRMVGLDLQRLEDRVHMFGAFMQWQLAVNLKQQGVETSVDPRTKMLRLDTVPENVCEQFSKRTVNGTDAAREYAEKLGLEWDKLSPERQVGLMKQGVQGDHNQAFRMGLSEDTARQLKRDGMSDWESWEGQAKDIGYEHQTVLGTQTEMDLTREQLLDIAYDRALDFLDEELQKRAGLSGGDLRVCCLRGLMAARIEGGEKEVDLLAKRLVRDGVRQDGQITKLSYGKAIVKGREVVRATTELHVEREQALIDLARKAAKNKSAALTVEKIAAAVEVWTSKPVENGGLRFDRDDHGRTQRQMIDRIGQDGKLSVLIGVAGSGKSTLLKPLTTAWHTEGRRVFGIALAWKQADAFAGTGVTPQRAQAVRYFLHPKVMERNKLTEKDVVVIDEVGLVGTKDLLELLELRKKVGFGLVMLGDEKQCQSIDAGPVLSLIQRALGPGAVPEILTTTRQLADEEKDTTAMFREGRAEEALVRKRENGTLHVIPGDYTAAVKAVADQWRKLKDANKHDPTYTVSISAPTNRDARLISAQIREKRRAMGEIGPDMVKIKATDQTGEEFDLKLAVGDRARLFSNTRVTMTTGEEGAIGRNASVLEVQGFRKDDKGKVVEIKLRNDLGNEAWVPWSKLRGSRESNPSQRVRLTYGDVLTTNSAQGETVDDHIHAMPGGTKGVNGFAAYTSGSRHRRSVYIMVSDGAERDDVSRHRPLGDQRPVREWDVIQNMARNLSRQPEKVSAIAILEMVGKLKKEVFQGLQNGMHRFEAREQAGMDRSTLSDTLERQHAEPHEAAVADQIDRMADRQERAASRMQEFHRSLREAVARGMETVAQSLRRRLDIGHRRDAPDVGPEL